MERKLIDGNFFTESWRNHAPYSRPVLTFAHLSCDGLTGVRPDSIFKLHFFVSSELGENASEIRAAV